MTQEPTLFLLFLFFGFSGVSTRSTTSGGSGGGGTTAGANVQKEILYILAFKCLWFQSCELCLQCVDSKSECTFAKRVAQMGSTPSILAALMSVFSLSAWLGTVSVHERLHG
jgi:hypothetical protein